MSSAKSSKLFGSTHATRARSVLRSVFSGFVVAACMFSVAVTGCINAPDFDIVPKIEFVGMTKDTMRQGLNQQDSIIVTFHFEDGDGDIGRMSGSDMNNVFFVDTRTGQIDNTFGIPFVPPQGSSNGIEGDVHIKIYSTCCIFPLGDPCEPSTQFPFDELTYQIYITDRAGHTSNTIETPLIKLRCN